MISFHQCSSTETSFIFDGGRWQVWAAGPKAPPYSNQGPGWPGNRIMAQTVSHHLTQQKCHPPNENAFSLWSWREIRNIISSRGAWNFGMVEFTFDCVILSKNCKKLQFFGNISAQKHMIFPHSNSNVTWVHKWQLGISKKKHIS